MPTGRVRWFDSKKCYGFITGDDGKEVFIAPSNIPAGFDLKSGMKVEYSEIEDRKGMQAFDIHPVRRSVPRRHTSEEMNAIIEDLIRLLDATSSKLKDGTWPDPRISNRLASMLRTVADDFEAGD